MKQLIVAEYYKLWKNKGIYAIFAMCSVPLIFGVLVALNIKGLSISEGAFDLISFPNNMWQFFMGTSLPIIIMSYLSASLGREAKNGTLIYQLTRTASRKKIILAKVLTILSLNVFYFILFLGVSLVSYLVFVQETVYASAGHFDSVSLETIMTSFLALAIQAMFCLLSLFLSLKVSTIGLVSIVFVATNLLAMVSNVKAVSTYVPGSLFYAPHVVGNASFSVLWGGQLLVLLVVSLLAIVAVNRFFSRV